MEKGITNLTGQRIGKKATSMMLKPNPPTPITIAERKRTIPRNPHSIIPRLPVCFTQPKEVHTNDHAVNVR